MNNQRLQEYICDYIDGTMSPQMKDVFEDFLNQNPTVNNFVQATLRGKSYLNLLSESPVPYPLNQGSGMSPSQELIQNRQGLNKEAMWSRLKLVTISISLFTATLAVGQYLFHNN